MPSLQTLFDSMTYEDMWEDAALRDCIAYARSSKLIEIPAEWRCSLPVEL